MGCDHTLGRKFGEYPARVFPHFSQSISQRVGPVGVVYDPARFAFGMAHFELYVRGVLVATDIGSVVVCCLPLVGGQVISEKLP